MKDHTPYSSYIEKGDDTVVALLTVGSLRTLSLKTNPGRKVTHQVPLHSGSLSVMSGTTQQKYDHSILKGICDDSDVICMILIGSTLSPEQQALSSLHPTTSQESSDQGSTSDNHRDGPSDISLLEPAKIPQVTVTNQEDRLLKTSQHSWTSTRQNQLCLCSQIKYCKSTTPVMLRQA